MLDIVAQRRGDGGSVLVTGAAAKQLDDRQRAAELALLAAYIETKIGVRAEVIVPGPITLMGREIRIPYHTLRICATIIIFDRPSLEALIEAGNRDREALRQFVMEVCHRFDKQFPTIPP